MSDTWEMIAWERRRLAEDLESLDEAQWASPTRCGDWTVREVAAHVSGLPSPIEAIVGVVRHLGNVDAFIAAAAEERAARTPAELVVDLRAFADSRRLAPGVPPPGGLLEVLVHGDDIRRAVGLTVDDRPDGHVTTALGFAVRSKSVFRGKARAAGLTLVADDLDWRHGDGPEVYGPALTLLAALLGRGDAAAELTGEGAATLVERAG